MAVFAIALRRFLAYEQALAWGDFPAFPHDPAGHMWRETAGAWQEIGLGYAIHQSPGLVFLSAGSLLFGNDPVLFQRLFYGSLLPLAFVAMYLALRDHVDAPEARGAGALLYALNPTTIGLFNGGSPGPLFAFALLPPVIAAAVRVMAEQDRSWRHVATMSLVFALGFTFYLNFAFVVLAGLVPLLVTYLLVRRDARYTLRVVTKLAAVAGILFLLALPMTLPLAMVVADAGSASDLPTYRTGRSQQDLLNDVGYTYRALTPDNTLRLTGNAGASDYWMGYTSQQAPKTLNWVGLSIPLVAFAAFLLASLARRPVVIGMGALIVTVATFGLLTHEGLMVSVFKGFPLLFVFRNPGGLMILIVFAMSTLVAITLDALHARASAWKGPSMPRGSLGTVACVAMVGTIFAYNAPLWSGDMSIVSLRGDLVFVPESYDDVHDFLVERTGREDPTILLVPYNGLHDVRGGVISRKIIEKDVARHPYPYAHEAFELLALNGTDRAGQLLAPLGVTHIVVDHTIPDPQAPGVPGWWPAGSPDAWDSMLGAQQDLERVYSTPSFTVYESVAPAPAEARPAIAVHGGANELVAAQALRAFPVFHENRILPLAGGALEDPLLADATAFVNALPPTIEISTVTSPPLGIVMIVDPSGASAEADAGWNESRAAWEGSGAIRTTFRVPSPHEATLLVAGAVDAGATASVGNATFAATFTNGTWTFDLGPLDEGDHEVVLVANGTVRALALHVGSTRPAEWPTSGSWSAANHSYSPLWEGPGLQGVQTVFGTQAYLREDAAARIDDSRFRDDAMRAPMLTMAGAAWLACIGYVVFPLLRRRREAQPG